MGDKDSADIFTEISRAVDKDLWFVEAHMQAER
jgi:starvation-inducible DNA-binding protein